MVSEQLQRELDKITALKKRLDGARPLTGTALKKLKEYIDVEWTYNSNAIEGNTLSLMETRLVILDGVTIGGKSVREHLEAINHKKAIDFVEGLAQKGMHDVTEKEILEIHGFVLREINDLESGKYRTQPVYISGSRHQPPDAVAIPLLMKDYVQELNQKSKELHPVLFSADAHYGLVKIHPFVDGNGRAARLLMNLILMGRGYPPAIIPVGQREEYLNALESAQTGGSMESFYILIAETVERALAQHLKALGYTQAGRGIHH